MRYGLYITCMFMIDLRKSESKQFLECWWRENILRSTQDQVGFPYCAWKLNTKIHALPDEKDPIGSWMENPYFRKLDPACSCNLCLAFPYLFPRILIEGEWCIST